MWDASEVTTLQGRACRGPSLALCSSSHCWYPGDTGNTAEGWRKTDLDGTGKVLGEQEVEVLAALWFGLEKRGEDLARKMLGFPKGKEAMRIPASRAV